MRGSSVGIVAAAATAVLGAVGATGEVVPHDAAWDEKMVSRHNAKAVFTEGTPVFTACSETGEALTTALKGKLAEEPDFANPFGAYVIEWDNGDATTRSAAAPMLYTSAAAATESLCKARLGPSWFEQPQTAKPIIGYVEPHLHMMSYKGFGGRLFYGDAMAPVEELKQCDGMTSHGLSQSAKSFKEGDTILGRLLECNDQEIESHMHDTRGFIAPGHPDNWADWPRWNSKAHQQSHVDWLKNAWSDGLKVVVMSAVNNELICELFALAKVKPMYGHSGDCSDAHNMKEQVNAYIQMAEDHSDWMEIALDGAHARRIATEGKLALVLHLEASDMLGVPPMVTGTDEEQQRQLEAWATGVIDEYYDMGVRAAQLTHQFNNPLSGAAPHMGLLHTGNQVLHFREKFSNFAHKLMKGKDRLAKAAKKTEEVLNEGLDAAESAAKKVWHKMKSVFDKSADAAKGFLEAYSEEGGDRLRRHVEQSRAMVEQAHGMGERGFGQTLNKILDLAEKCPDHTIDMLGRVAEWFVTATPRLRKHVRAKMKLHYHVNGRKTNPLGLSDLGKFLTKYMQSKNMILDSAHLSKAGGRDVFDISRQNKHYPIFVSHAPLALPRFAALNHDYAMDQFVLRRIMATGGFVGLRSDVYNSPTYALTTVENTCPGSVRSLAQVMQPLEQLGVGYALASDLNGLAANSSPRFGSKEGETCARQWEMHGCEDPRTAEGLKGKKKKEMEKWMEECSALATARDEYAALQQKGAQANEYGGKDWERRVNDYNAKGFATIDSVGPLYADLTDIGFKSYSQSHSAEHFIAMWERIVDPARTALQSPKPQEIAAFLEETVFSQSGAGPHHDPLRVTPTIAKQAAQMDYDEQAKGLLSAKQWKALNKKAARQKKRRARKRARAERKGKDPSKWEEEEHELHLHQKAEASVSAVLGSEVYDEYHLAEQPDPEESSPIGDTSL